MIDGRSLVELPTVAGWSYTVATPSHVAPHSFFFVHRESARVLYTLKVITMIRFLFLYNAPATNLISVFVSYCRIRSTVVVSGRSFENVRDAFCVSRTTIRPLLLQSVALCNLSPRRETPKAMLRMQ